MVKVPLSRFQSTNPPSLQPPPTLLLPIDALASQKLTLPRNFVIPIRNLPTIGSENALPKFGFRGIMEGRCREIGNESIEEQ
jgi:hypothetical protein